MRNLTLQKTNIIACVLHSLSFIAVLVLYLVYKKSRPLGNVNFYRNQLSGQISSIVPPVYPDTLPYCSTGGNVNPGQCTVSPNFQQPKKVSMMNVVVSCMIFFAITAIFHALYAWDGFIPGLSKHSKGFYTTVIDDGWNPYRWIEYGLTASLMSVILGSVQGTGDILTILFMAGVTGAMQFGGGYTSESVMRKSIVENIGFVQKQVLLGSSLSAWLLFIFLWFANFYCFTTTAIEIKKKFKDIIDPETNEPIKVQGFVYFLVIFKFLSYLSFGLIQFYQIYKNWNVINYTKLINFENIEILYLMLSFISKFGLAGGVSFGLLLQTKDCN